MLGQAKLIPCFLSASRLRQNTAASTGTLGIINSVYTNLITCLELMGVCESPSLLLVVLHSIFHYHNFDP